MGSVGLFNLPDTRATSQHLYSKDRLMMELQICRKEEQVLAATFGKGNSVTVAVHCCAHSLNLCFKTLEDSFHVFRMLLKELKK